MLNFGKSRGDAESSIDSFLEQKIVLPQVFLKPVDGETHLRVYGQTEYEKSRKDLLDQSQLAKEPFWSGKVYVRAAEVSRPAGPGMIMEVVHANQVIGEISEFDTIAQNVFEFAAGEVYVARAVIRADLIGNLVHLFVNTENRVS